MLQGCGQKCSLDVHKWPEGTWKARAHPQQHHPFAQGHPFSMKIWLTTGRNPQTNTPSTPKCSHCHPCTSVTQLAITSCVCGATPSSHNHHSFTRFQALHNCIWPKDLDSDQLQVRALEGCQRSKVISGRQTPHLCYSNLLSDFYLETDYFRN